MSHLPHKARDAYMAMGKRDCQDCAKHFQGFLDWDYDTDLKEYYRESYYSWSDDIKRAYRQGFNREYNRLDMEQG